MEELLIIALQFVLELLLEILIWFPWDIFLVWRDKRTATAKTPPGNGAVFAGGLIFGAMFGGLSLIVLQRAILDDASARLANLILAPLVCALVARGLARRRVRRGQPSDEKLHFWFALLFSAAFVLVRFMWAVRPTATG